MNYKILYILLFCVHYCFSQQQKIDKQIDSLSKLSYKVLIDSFYNVSELKSQELYAESILTKAKKEKDTVRLIVGYKFYCDIYKELSDKPRLQYLDSLIKISSLKPNRYFPLTAYQNKGYLLHKKRNFKEAINAFVKANEYAIKYNDIQLIFSSNYFIARLKDRIGNHKEALNIHDYNTKFAKQNIDEIGNSYYLRSIFALAFTHKNLNNIDSARFYNSYGIKKSKELKIKSVIPYFSINEGILLFHERKYEKAIKKIDSSRLYFEHKKDLPNLSEAYFYLGKISLGLNKEKKAIQYFKKVDSIFMKINDLLPELRENYILLSNYYKKENDLKQQLLYIEKLIEIDSILNNNYIYINDYLKREYDIPKIVSQKEDIIIELKNNNKSKTIYTYSIILLIGAIAIVLYRRQLIFKKRFEKLLKQTSKTGKIDLLASKEFIDNKQNKLDIPEDIVNNILDGLLNFEQSESFLDSNVKLTSLAKLLNTNTNYLSKTINHFKGKNINVYLNSLRVKYAVNKIKEDSKFRKYTIKAIAKEVGFKSSETFSKTFYKETGIYPSYFIKQIEKPKNKLKN